MAVSSSWTKTVDELSQDDVVATAFVRNVLLPSLNRVLKSVSDDDITSVKRREIPPITSSKSVRRTHFRPGEATVVVAPMVKNDYV